MNRSLREFETISKLGYGALSNNSSNGAGYVQMKEMKKGKLNQERAFHR